MVTMYACVARKHYSVLQNFDEPHVLKTSTYSTRHNQNRVEICVQVTIRVYPSLICVYFITLQSIFICN